MADPMQVTPLVPGQGNSTTAPVDPNLNLLNVLQTLLKQNAPVTDISQATPDQKAAAKASADAKETTANIKPVAAAAPAQGALPNVLSLLGLTPQDDTSKTDTSKTKTADVTTTKKQSGLSNILDMVSGGDIDKTSKIGGALKAVSTLAMFL